MTVTIKKVLAGALTSPVIASLAKRATRPHLAILMLHRFRDEERGTPGHDPEFLRQVLAFLRDHRIPTHSLRDAVQSLRVGQPVDGVVFTVDDGYADFDSVGAPIFREFECPVTLFVTTGFVDGEYWFWWDRISHAIQRTDAASVIIASPEGNAPAPLRTAQERAAAEGRIHAAVKDRPESDRAVHVAGILEQLDVAVPDTPPPAYRPMTWERIRHWSERGVDFGPHTHGHPSMGSVSLAAGRNEVATSYSRLSQEIPDPLAVHCYPYGLAGDLSAEAALAAREEGMHAAVTALPGSIREPAKQDLFLLPRYSFPDRLVDVKQIVFGIEHLKHLVRERGAGARAPASDVA